MDGEMTVLIIRSALAKHRAECCGVLVYEALQTIELAMPIACPEITTRQQSMILLKGKHCVHRAEDGQASPHR
eukprot:2058272-Pyramimonas_sp.AAC.1